MHTRVVVTGLGMVCPVGLTRDQSWESVVEGRSGIRRIKAFVPQEYGLRTQIAGEAWGFDPANYLEPKEAKRLDRFSQLAVVAADEAVKQANLTIGPTQAAHVGTLIATAIGGIHTIGTQWEVLARSGSRRVNPYTIPMLMTNAASGVVSIRTGAKGPCFSISSACASSTDAIGVALDLIRSGRAKAMIVGGVDAGVHPLVVSGFEQARALCTDSNDNPSHGSRPFDRTRSGFVIGEGAAVLVIEDESFARARGAQPLCELAGYGSAADAYHITAPDPEARGAVAAMTGAVSDAGADMTDVVYVNAHGTSTQLNDRSESMGIRTAFGAHADSLCVSSTKSMTGHLGGAAGALEAAFSVLAAVHRMAPPTINYQEPDPECDLDYVPNGARSFSSGIVLSNSFGFGGHSSSLSFRPL